jgi:hypothetical protein
VMKVEVHKHFYLNFFFNVDNPWLSIIWAST